MKIARLVVVIMLFASVGWVDARVVRNWSEEELLASSDLVVLATPLASHETTEHIKLEWWQLIGVETQFAVSKVLKGNPSVKSIVLHHYRYAEAKDAGGVNAPRLMPFDLSKKQTFRLFLVREADGRYAPVAGQLEGRETSVREVKK